MSSVATAIDALNAAGQHDLAKVLDALDASGQQKLADQVNALDFDLVGDLIEQFVKGDQADKPLGSVGEAETIPLPADDAARASEQAARDAGEALLRSGKVAAFLLAGGQGSRLGFDGPKGDYPYRPITGGTLFAQHAAKIAAVRTRYGCDLPWYIMTSPQNDEATKDIFASADYFGLDPASVSFVVQGTLPAVDAKTGALLRATPDSLAQAADGHGGLFSALRKSGALEEMSAAGISTIYSFQVDNPKLRICRPEFLGYHQLAGAEMSNTAVRKESAGEKMGVVAKIDGTTAMVEYSDLPDELAEKRNDDGSLTYWAGSIAVHCIDVDFALRLTEGRLQLPFHRAHKKITHLSPSGDVVTPVEPNAIKFEAFLFDALPMASASVTMEAARDDEFSPIKNADGSNSPESARELMNEMYGRWFAAAGVTVPTGPDGKPVDLEIDPRFALDPAELAANLPEGFTLDGPTALGPDGTKRNA